MPKNAKLKHFYGQPGNDNCCEYDGTYEKRRYGAAIPLLLFWGTTVAFFAVAFTTVVPGFGMARFGPLRITTYTQEVPAQFQPIGACINTMKDVRQAASGVPEEAHRTRTEPISQRHFRRRRNARKYCIDENEN